MLDFHQKLNEIYVHVDLGAGRVTASLLSEISKIL